MVDIKSPTEILDIFLSELDDRFPKAMGKILNILDLAKTSPEIKTIVKSDLWSIFDSFKLLSEKRCNQIIDFCASEIEDVLT